VNRAERRQATRDDKAAKWRTLARQFRGMADLDALPIEDRAALRKAAAQLDRGRRPLVVLARISPTLARIEAMTREGDL
jgi:hypothetical protein